MNEAKWLVLCVKKKKKIDMNKSTEMKVLKSRRGGKKEEGKKWIFFSSVISKKESKAIFTSAEEVFYDIEAEV